MKRLFIPIVCLTLAALAIWHPAPRPAGFASISTAGGAAARPAATGVAVDTMAATTTSRSRHSRVHRKRKKRTRKPHRKRTRKPKHRAHAPKRHHEVPVNPVDLNRASADALAEVPGIGPAIAERIVAFRELNGPFATLDELLDVSGVTPGHLDRAAPYLLVR